MGKRGWEERRGRQGRRELKQACALTCHACLPVPSPLRRCVEEMLRCVGREGAEVMVASHNQQSIEAAVERMAALGLPPASGVYFGQLLGEAGAGG